MNLAPRLGDIKDDGIVAGEIIAYRCWRLRADGKLASVYQSETVWEPGTPLEGDPEKNGEGVHGFKRRIDLASYGLSYTNGAPTTNPIVSGTVSLWGMVIEHERGYRAARAEVREIDDSPDYDAEALRKLYGLLLP